MLELAAMNGETQFYIGTMGYGYKGWQNGVFYPRGMPATSQLSYYAKIFNAVEMDTTFYGSPPIERVKKWAAAVPNDFVFCPKVPRIISHEHRLIGEAAPLFQEFIASVRHFAGKLGPILLQLPPDFEMGESPSLLLFLNLLPNDLRFAVEFRHQSWYKRSVSELLQARGVAWVSTDYIHMPKQIHLTADFVFLRLLGRHGAYPDKNAEQIDSTPRVRWWAEQIHAKLPEIKAAYIFANNDYAGFSPATANNVKRALGMPANPIKPIQQPPLLNN